MSTGWGRGPRGDNGPQGTRKAVPRQARLKEEHGVSTAPPFPTQTPGRPYLTREIIDLSCLPSKLTKLQRSPEHKANPPGVWTTGLNGKSSYDEYINPTGIILTDIACNKSPDLILQSPRQISETSISLYSPRCIISKASSSSDSSRRDSNIPEGPRGPLLSRIYSALRSRLFCWKSSRSSSISSISHNITEKRSSFEYHKKEKKYSAKRHPSSLYESEVSPSSDKEISKSVQNNQLKPPDQEPKSNVRLRASRSLLDLQREKERAELSPARYIADIEVLHNIRRREIVAKALYRESGQLFARIGRPGESNPPLPPYMLISGAAPLPPIKRNFETNPSMNNEEREKILSKIIGQKPHLESVSTGEERDPLWEKCAFAQECLRAHNLYRARHSAPPLQLCSKLCNTAQDWANHLAQTGILRHKGDPRFGENIFCRNVALAIKSQLSVPDITGEEVAAYWYSNVRQYRFNLNDSALQAHAGSYSQMVWKTSQKFGIGKALSRNGKLVVVANYFPPGNIANTFRYNVLPLNTRALAAEMLGQGNAMLEEAMAEPDEEEISLQRALINIGMGVSGVLAAQPPNITGRNATKILAAYMLGHAAAVVTTPDEKLDVVIVSRRSLKRKKSGKKQDEIPATSNMNISPLDRLVEKLNKENTNFDHVEKALKEIINMKLKQQESLSAPNILTSTGAERRPKLSVMKKVKFKSEENINYRDRSKAVQTSFSSENLSTDEGVLDISESIQTSPCVESEEETISGLSETTSSLFSNTNNTKISSNSTETVSTTYDSQTREYTSCSKSASFKIRSNTQETENNSEIASNSQYQSTDTSLSLAPLSSGEFNTLSANPSFSSSGSEANQESSNIQQKCTLRRIYTNEKGYTSSLDSISSLSSDAFRERITSSSDADDDKSSKLNLPFDSPTKECGLLNCYALSPLHY